MKLTYWKSQCQTDSNAYSLRAKSMKSLVEKLATEGFVLIDGEYRHTESCRSASFGPIEKICVTYTDAFDLARQLLGDESPWY